MTALMRRDSRSAMAVLFVLVGCTTDGVTGDAFVVRDSAGVEIVENSPGAGPIPRWAVSPEPQLRLGLVDSDGPEQFIDVSVTRLSTGEVVALEARGAELRFFDGTGRHLRTVGGIGGGPGEFRSATAFTRAPGDTLLVQDLVMRSVLVFSPAGEFVRSYAMMPFGPGLGNFCFRAPLLPDGSMIRCGETDEQMPTMGQPSGPSDQVFQLVRVVPESNEIQRIRPFTRNRGYIITTDQFLTGVGHPFQAAGHLAVGGDPPRILIADGPDYAIEVWTFDGQLERIVRSTVPARAPTAAESDQAWAQVLASADEMFVGQIQSVVERPSAIPPIQGLAAGAEGEIWVKREPFLDTQARTMFDVFDRSGRRIAEVVLPAVIDVHEVGEDYLLGVRKDEFDVPIVEMYGMERP